MSWRRWLLIALIILFLVFLYTQREELAGLVRILEQGDYRFLIVVFILQAAQYLVYAYSYQAAFSIVGVESRFWELVPVIFASEFINNVAPAGGFAGAALLVDDAVLRAQSGARAAVAVLLVTVIETLTVLPFLVLGVSSLIAVRQILLYQLLAFTFYLIFVAILLTALFLGRWSPGFLKSIFFFVQTKINSISEKVFKREIISRSWAEENAREFIDASVVITKYWKRVGLVVIYVFASVVLNLLSLFFAFLSFGEMVSLSVLSAGYTLGFVYAIISLLPLDAALMQTIMVLVYSFLGVQTATALAVILVFGGISAWLPILIGFIFLTRVRSFRG